MYLSQLEINPECMQARRDLSDIYEMHRTLSRCFNNYKKSNMIFRIENKKNGSIIVLMQSNTEPMWKHLNEFDNYLLAKPKSKKISYDKITDGMMLTFRLYANPTKYIKSKIDNKKRRVGIFDENEQKEWLVKKESDNGFKVVQVHAIADGKKKGKAKNITMYAVMFEGILKITDSNKFEQALKNGVGRGKRFGFGLLSVAKA